MNNSLRILIVDGYAAAGRKDLIEGGASIAAELYAQMLRSHAPENANVVCDTLFIADEDAVLPTGTSLDQYDGIAWTGSSLTIHVDEPRVRKQIDFARSVYAAGTPSFGSCWAAQMAVTAAGGLCAVNPKGREFGISRKITLTDLGRSHPMYRGKKHVFDAFTSHGDEIISLPAGAQHLASNGHSMVQGVSVTHEKGTFWAVQYHPEYDLSEIAGLTSTRRDWLLDLGNYRTLEAADHHIKELRALHNDPSRNDIAWKLAIDEDVLDPKIRQAEVINWFNELVLPVKMRRS